MCLIDKDSILCVIFMDESQKVYVMGGRDVMSVCEALVVELLQARQLKVKM